MIAVALIVLIGAGIGVEVLHRSPTDNEERAIVGGVEAAPQAQVPTTKEELGQLLFHDGRLSGDGSTSCSSCHSPNGAFTDSQSLSDGYSRGSLYFRNTPTLINASKMPSYYWDGRFSQGDLASVARDHIAEAHFMNLDGRLLVERMRQVPEYEEGFIQAFGSEG